MNILTIYNIPQSGILYIITHYILVFEYINNIYCPSNGKKSYDKEIIQPFNQYELPPIIYNYKGLRTGLNTYYYSFNFILFLMII